MEARDGKHSFTLGIKRYADLTHNEWHRIQFQANYVPTTSGSKYFFENARNDMNLSMPKCIDWRTMVTFVLNQFLSTNFIYEIMLWILLRYNNFSCHFRVTLRP